MLIESEVLAAMDPAGWLARLQLQYACIGGSTRLVKRAHQGPLAVQKMLYPEGPAVCHTLILHPPGGIAGNDTLDIGLTLRAGSHVLVTMPGACKWYRSNDAAAMQRLVIEEEAGAVLEWLPPESIVFNGAAARAHTAVSLAAGANYLGWDILCLGRTASGETFASGDLHQTTDILVAGVPVWGERCRLRGGSPLLGSPAGLGGAPVSAVMIAAGMSVPAELLARCRAVAVDAEARVGITAMPHILIARYVGHAVEQAKRYFVTLWQLLRPFYAGRSAALPRIWAT